MSRGAWIALGLCAALAGCAGAKPEASRAGFLLIGSSGSSPEAARRSLRDFLELYLSTAVIARSTQVLEGRIISRPEIYLSGAGLDHSRLLHDLKSLDLWARESVGRLPRALVILDGKPAPSLRRTFLKKGYETVDSLPAEVVIRGRSTIRSSEDGRWRSLKAALASLSVEVSTGAGIFVLSQEASAVDLSSASASAKALENAGELVAASAARSLGGDLKALPEISVLIPGQAAGLADVKRLIRDLRSMPAVSAVFLEDIPSPAWRLSVRARRAAADLARAIQERRGGEFRPRSVDEDRIELEPGSGGR